MNLYITVFTLFFMIVILIVISKYIKTYCPKKQCENIDKFYDISFSITSDTFDNNIPLTTSEKHSIDIFLSHSTIDYKQVRKLRNALEEEDFRPLMFHLKCLEESDDNEIFDLLKREIDAREWFILCKSPHAESSKWVQKEMEYVQKHKVPIVIDINSNTWNIKEIMDMLRENNNINLIYPKNLFSALQNVKKHLQINYNISEIVYQENPLELSSIYKTKNNF